MVTINLIQWTTSNGQLTPKLHPHTLKCIKSAPTFHVGETTTCYITKYDNGRYAVFSASGVKDTKYHVFDSAEQLHGHFDEL